MHAFFLQRLACSRGFRVMSLSRNSYKYTFPYFLWQSWDGWGYLSQYSRWVNIEVLSWFFFSFMQHFHILTQTFLCLFYFSCSRCRSYFLAKVSHWCMDEKSRSLQLLWPDWQKCTWLPRHTTRWKYVDLGITVIIVTPVLMLAYFDASFVYVT